MTSQGKDSVVIRTKAIPWLAWLPFVAIGIPLGLGLFTFNYGGGGRVFF